jgi:cystathionine gamma-synthase
MNVTLKVMVVSQPPPGGRCRLYAGYADVLERHLKADAELTISTTRDAHGEGFPCLRLNGIPVQPEDGVILMPADVMAALVTQGVPDEAMFGLIEALEVPLDRMLEEEG